MVISDAVFDSLIANIRGQCWFPNSLLFSLIAGAFMAASNVTYLNVGIYTVPEASRLSGVSKERIRRWLRVYRSNLRRKKYSPLWKPQLPAIDNKVALGFLDLIEVKFVGTFLDRGVSWPMIHKVREKAAALIPTLATRSVYGGFLRTVSESSLRCTRKPEKAACWK